MQFLAHLAKGNVSFFHHFASVVHFHRCFLPSFSSFGPMVSEEKIFKDGPIRNKNCLWRPCLLMDRDAISNHYRGPSIDASYQVSVHLAEGFQRRRLKCEKLMDIYGRSSIKTANFVLIH
jgi:hypothetical protein